MPDAARVRILLVEDDALCASLYATKFEREGFEVVHACDGEEGLSIAEATLPDVMVLELLIPKLDGFEVLRRARRMSALARMPILILTSLAEKASVERCFQEGATEYLIKAHVSPSDAVREVKRALQLN